MADAMRRAPIVVTGSDCSYDPFARKGQATECGRLLDDLSKDGVAYSKQAGPATVLTIGGKPVAIDLGESKEAGAARKQAIEAALADAGYKLEKSVPPLSQALQVVLAIVVIGMLSGMTYGPVAALLVELFPARIRYTSMSVPYHIGTGYFGGFLPFISQYIVAKTGDPFAGLWYTIGVVAVALVVSFLWLPETAGKELD